MRTSAALSGCAGTAEPAQLPECAGRKAWVFKSLLKRLNGAVETIGNQLFRRVRASFPAGESGPLAPAVMKGRLISSPSFAIARSCFFRCFLQGGRANGLCSSRHCWIYEFVDQPVRRFLVSLATEVWRDWDYVHTLRQPPGWNERCRHRGRIRRWFVGTSLQAVGLRGPTGGSL